MRRGWDYSAANFIKEDHYIHIQSYWLEHKTVYVTNQSIFDKKYHRYTCCAKLTMFLVVFGLFNFCLQQIFTDSSRICIRPIFR